MANVTIDNGTLADYVAATKAIVGGAHVVATELVTSVEGGAKIDLAKAEDTIFADGDFGLMSLGVRKDTAVSLAGTDGDYMPVIFDALGRLHVNAGVVPGAARTSDAVSAAFAVDKLMLDKTELTPGGAVISTAASGATALVAAQGSGNKIKVHSAFLIASGTTTVKFQGATTDLCGAMALVANVGIVLPFNPVGWFVDTAANVALNINLGSAIQVSGAIRYTVVT